MSATNCSLLFDIKPATTAQEAKRKKKKRITFRDNLGGFRGCLAEAAAVHKSLLAFISLEDKHSQHS